MNSLNFLSMVQLQHKKFQNNLSSIYDTISTKRYQFINRFCKDKEYNCSKSHLGHKYRYHNGVQIDRSLLRLWWIIQKHPPKNYVIIRLWWDEGDSGEPCQDRNHQDQDHHDHVGETSADICAVVSVNTCQVPCSLLLVWLWLQRLCKLTSNNTESVVSRYKNWTWLTIENTFGP